MSNVWSSHQLFFLTLQEVRGNDWVPLQLAVDDGKLDSLVSGHIVLLGSQNYFKKTSNKAIPRASIIVRIDRPTC